MATTFSSYSDLVPRLLAVVGSIPPGFALECIRQAGRQFCQDTYLWQQDLPPMPAVAYQQDYTLPVYADAFVENIVSASLFGRTQASECFELVDGTTLRWHPDLWPNRSETYDAYSALATYAAGDHVTYGTTSSYQIYRCMVAIATPEAWTPTHWQIDTLTGIRTRVVLVPNATSVGVPSPILNGYDRAILAYARYMAFSESNKPWSVPLPRGARTVHQPAPAAQALQEYQQAVNDARCSVASRGNSALNVARIPYNF